jgi:hypothetical protein
VCDTYHGASLTGMYLCRHGWWEWSCPRDKQGIAMTDLNNENRELNLDELAIDQLDSVSGGRFKIQTPDPLKAIKIAKIESDNPGF